MKNVRLALTLEMVKARLIHWSRKEHPVLRHLDNLPETQDPKPAKFTLADTKDSEATFSEVGYHTDKRLLQGC